MRTFLTKNHRVKLNFVNDDANRYPSDVTQFFEEETVIISAAAIQLSR